MLVKGQKKIHCFYWKRHCKKKRKSGQLLSSSLMWINTFLKLLFPIMLVCKNCEVLKHCRCWQKNRVDYQKKPSTFFSEESELHLIGQDKICPYLPLWPGLAREKKSTRWGQSWKSYFLVFASQSPAVQTCCSLCWRAKTSWLAWWSVPITSSSDWYCQDVMIFTT